MNAIRLAFAFVRVPRLFGSLFLFPLIISFVLLYVQLMVTGLLLKATKTNAATVRENLTKTKNNSVVRRLIAGNGEEIGELEVCRWIKNGTEEVLPPHCRRQPFDVGLIIPSLNEESISQYVKLLNGNFRRLHVCETTACTTEVTIDLSRPDQPVTSAKSIWGLLLLNLVELSPERIEQVVKLREHKDKLREQLGALYLYTPGYQDPLNVREMKKLVVVILNFILLVLVALWLALKAHRKVLDYFASSGALLPLVAASGKRTFYSAIWILTLFRVFIFLAGSLPISYFAIKDFTQGDPTQLFFHGELSWSLLWLFTLAMSLALATIIASIADLKHRHTLLSIGYRYVPLVVSLGGGLVWGLSFLVDHQYSEAIRKILASLPLAGMAPMLLAPLFTPQEEVLVINTLLTSVLLALALRSNTRWFAAHLEEL